MLPDVPKQMGPVSGVCHPSTEVGDPAKSSCSHDLNLHHCIFNFPLSLGVSPSDSCHSLLRGPWQVLPLLCPGINFFFASPAHSFVTAGFNKGINAEKSRAVGQAQPDGFLQLPYQPLGLGHQLRLVLSRSWSTCL